MTFDLILTTTAALVFIIFLSFQIVLFRHVSHERVIFWLAVVYIGVGLPLAITSSILLFPAEISRTLFSIIVVFALYSLLVFIYILGVFGIMESSIRIRLLTEVAGKGKKGLPLSKLLTYYNRETIIQKRLNRFVSSGDLLYKNGTYRATERYSLFLLPSQMLRFIWNLYGKSAI